MSLVAHQFGHVKFRISLDVFYRQVETIKKKKKKNRKSKFEIRNVQIDVLT